MNNLISVGTGLIYKFTSDRDEMVTILKKFEIDGIEFCLADPSYIYEFELSSTNLEYLKGLKRVSLHGPWVGMNYGNNIKSIDVLAAIGNLAIEIDAKNVNFDSAEISDFSIFKRYPFQTSIENDDWRKKIKTPDQIEKILDENPSLNFNFDFAHALTVDVESIPIFLSKFKNRIAQIHLAYLNRNLSNHRFLFQAPKEELTAIKEYLKLIPEDIPVVLECVADKREEIDLIKEEINFLRSI